MMPVPMVECTLCGETVTKRSTISLQALGVGGGRACRNHEDVAQLMQRLTEISEHERTCRDADRNLTIILAAAAVRVQCTLHGISPEALYDRFRWAGMRAGDLQAVKKEVERLGGPRMSAVDIAGMLMDATQLLAN
jgi:hypothetical protein